MALWIGRFHFYLGRPESPPDNFFGRNLPTRHRQPAQVRLHFRKVAPCVDKRTEGHVTADSGETIKIGDFHVAERVAPGSVSREERALYAMILASPCSTVKLTRPSLPQILDLANLQRHSIDD